MKNFKKRYPDFKLYEKSLNKINGKYWFLVSKNNEKFIVIGENDYQFFPAIKNTEILQKAFSFLKPRICGVKNSFGFGDRLGIATPGHIRALNTYNFFPVFAQQSVRELERTGRTFKDVINSAVVGCFQEGYKDEFGADADHMKKVSHLKQALDAGFTFFTIDPSDKIYNIKKISAEKKKKILTKYFPSYEKIYLERRYHIRNTTYQISRDVLEELILVYAEAIEYIEECYKFLKGYIRVFDFEVSVDETTVATTPFAHLFIVEELRRRDIEFQSIAFRFPGHFEKAIDYKGDIEKLKEIFLIHQSIREKLGNYKISLHSGSDKFSIYPLFKEIFRDKIHIKTSGTSWIEAVKLVAIKDFRFFIEILECGLKNFEENAASYEISVRPENVDLKNLGNISVEDLFNNNDIRQIIHISYGSILGEKSKDSKFLYRERLLNLLKKYEADYYNLLENHLGRHLRLLS